MPVKPLIPISRAHRIRVHEDTAQGSDPRPGFFVMVALSALIASFGLIMDSTAVVIGAMLVAPLMTPIFGLALALVQGNPRLLGLALRSEIAGVGLALLVSWLLGEAIPYFEATREMLSRTEPSLLDMLVAILAGAAGAYALVNERLSPALPGVAISTAIVPPLANAGLCLSLSEYDGAWGSFLLFLTNFLSILLVAAGIFWLSGMGREVGPSRRLESARHFGLAVAGLAVVGVFLGVELANIIENRRLRRDIRTILQEELSSFRVTDLVKLVHRHDGDEVYVLAQIRAPWVFPPRIVKRIELRMEEELERPFELYLRTTIAQSVSASGSINQDLVETLGGFSFANEPSEQAELLQVAEHVIREYLGNKLGQTLEALRAFPFGEQTWLLAEVRGLRSLRRTEVAELEGLVRERVGDDGLLLGVRQDEVDVTAPDGTLRFELTMRRPASEEEQRVLDAAEGFVGDALRQRGYAVVNTSVTRLDGEYYGFFEVAGPPSLAPEDVARIGEDLRRELGTPFQIFVRLLPESVVAATGYTTWEEVLTDFGRRTSNYYRAETDRLIQQWR